MERECETDVCRSRANCSISWMWSRTGAGCSRGKNPLNFGMLYSEVWSRKPEAWSITRRPPLRLGWGEISVSAWQAREHCSSGVQLTGGNRCILPCQGQACT